MVQRPLQHLRLFGDFLGHEMFIAALVDLCGVDMDLAQIAVGKIARRIADFQGIARDDRPIAFVQIGDPVGHRRKRDGI